MFLFHLCILLLSVTVSFAFEDPASDQTWNDFKSQFGKRYSGPEDLKRRLIFLENNRLINERNRERSGQQFELKVNRFADLTHEEFLNEMTFPVNRTSGSRYRSALVGSGAPLLGPIPNEKDWRKEGFVSPVMDQGPCATGSVFAAASAMEGQERTTQLSKLVELSAQKLYDCCGTGSCPDCSTGGNLSPLEYFECVEDIGGLDSSRCYPFTGQCHLCRTTPKCVSVEVQGYATVQSGNEELLRQTVAWVGPVAASIDASAASFQFLSGKVVYSDSTCRKDKLNHSVTIVGYGFEGSVPYWLVKNSWGTSWGDQGYAKIFRNRNMCGIATQAVYPYITVRV